MHIKGENFGEGSDWVASVECRENKSDKILKKNYNNLSSAENVTNGKRRLG